jgi:hypothetical protein
MNEDGQIIAPKEDPHLSQEKVVAMYVLSPDSTHDFL